MNKLYVKLQIVNLSDNLLMLTEFPFSYSLLVIIVLLGGQQFDLENISYARFAPLLILLGLLATTLSITDPFGRILRFIGRHFTPTNLGLESLGSHSQTGVIKYHETTAVPSPGSKEPNLDFFDVNAVKKKLDNLRQEIRKLRIELDKAEEEERSMNPANTDEEMERKRQKSWVNSPGVSI